MLINDLIALLMNIPTALAAGWGIWFAAGLALSIWSRREKSRLVMHGYQDETPAPAPAPTPAAARPPVRKAVLVPHSSGDAFGELAQLLEQQTESTHRTPGESPVLREEPAQTAPVLAAPQSLP
jgi:hypothetical protein